jgi:hypothetical protein
MAGSWRMAQESWWPSEAITEFKLRAALGTSGGRPGFSDRFETWSVSGAGNVSKATLGNKELKPEFSKELEIGADIILNNRYSLQITHAGSTTTDQLLQIPLPGLYGYSTQWQNAGTVKNDTWEATIEASLVQTPTTTWTLGLVGDRTRSKITEFDRGCYRTGSSTFYYCAGVEFGTMYGYNFITSPSQLPAGANAADFQLNDDGVLVAVGAGNSYTDGLTKDLWGTRITSGGSSYDWGMPVLENDSTGSQALLPIGDGNPDFNLGLSSNLTWRRFNLYTLIDGKFGGDVYNNTHQWAYRDYTHADYDQTGKSEETKKPVSYYQKLYNTNSTVSWFVEDGSYIKLRQVALQYAFDRQQLQKVFGGLGIERLTLGLVGRNLITISDYSGFDPEVGSVEQPYDGFSYPHYRTYTLKFDVEF